MRPPHAHLSKSKAAPALASALLAALYVLGFPVIVSTLPAPTSQLYLVCKPSGTAVCTAWPITNQDYLTYRGPKPKIKCGFSTLKKISPHRKFFKVKVQFGTGTIFCNSGKLLFENVFKWNMSKFDFGIPKRKPRAAGYGPRGRYRGQTQSQYLSIDQGNDKDEGKAEAHSDADSSRAIVSGTSGMGQAQSQSMYEPSCDECMGRSDLDADNLKLKPSDGFSTLSDNKRPTIGTVPPNRQGTGTTWSSDMPGSNIDLSKSKGQNYEGTFPNQGRTPGEISAINPNKIADANIGVNPNYSGLPGQNSISTQGGSPGSNTGQYPFQSGKFGNSQGRIPGVETSMYPNQSGQGGSSNIYPNQNVRQNEQYPNSGISGLQPNNLGQDGTLDGRKFPLGVNGNTHLEPNTGGSPTRYPDQDGSNFPNHGSIPNPNLGRIPYQGGIMSGANGNLYPNQGSNTGSNSYPGRDFRQEASYPNQGSATETFPNSGTKVDFPNQANNAAFLYDRPKPGINGSPILPVQGNGPIHSGSYVGPNGLTYYCCVVGPNQQTGQEGGVSLTPGSHYIPGGLLGPTNNGAHLPGGQRGGIGQSPGGTHGPVQSTGGTYGPGQLTGGTYGPGQAPGGTYGPGQAPGGTYGSGQLPGGIYAPGQVSGGTYGPGQAPGGTYDPKQVSGGTYGPGQSIGGTNGPRQSSGGTYSPGGGGGSGAYGPGQIAGGTYGPGQPPGGIYQPGQLTGGTYVPGQSPGRIYGPGQATGGTYGPGQASGGTYEPGKYGPGQAPGGTYGPGQAPGGTYEPGQAPGGTYEPGQSPGGTYGPGQMPGGTYEPGQSLGGTYGPGQTPGGTYGPGHSPGGTYGQGQAPGGTYGSGQAPGGTYGPGQAAGGTNGPGQSTGGTFGPAQSTGGTYGPGQSPSGLYVPGQAPGGTYGPGQSSGATYVPGQALDGLYGPGQAPGATYGPDNSHGGLYGPGQAPGATYGPGQASGGTYGTGQAPGGTYGPGQAPGGTFRPGQAPGGTYGPVQAPGGSYRPGQTPVGTYGPGQAPIGTYGPGQSPGGTYRPGQTPGGTYGPGQVPGGTYEPAQSPGGTYGPGQAPGGSYRPGQTLVGTYGPGQAPIGTYGPGQTPGGTYGPGQVPGGTYGAGQAPSGTYGPGQAPGGTYGSGQAPSVTYGPGQAPGGIYGPGQAPSGTYGPGQAPGATYGPGQAPSGTYGPGQAPGGTYGPGKAPDGIYRPGQSLGGTYGPAQSPGGIYGPGQAPGGINGPGQAPGGNGPWVAGTNNQNGIPQNVLDPNSIAASLDDYDSNAEATVSQNTNGTVASASSTGGNDKGRAQTNVQGTYTGSGSFTAQAEISDENKAAQSQVEGGKKGAKSSAQGRGRNNLSQASVQLGSETGSLQTAAETKGSLHSSNSKVQGSVKGGMADAQAKGPGSTSSQAQIGFTPYKEGDKDHGKMKSPFVGQGTASAQSSGRSGQSQSSLGGTFKYGISYSGAAQSGASLDKDAVFPSRLPYNNLNVYDENNKNINVETEGSLDIESATENDASLDNKTESYLNVSASEQSSHTHSDHHPSDKEIQTQSKGVAAGTRRSFQPAYGSNGGEFEYTTGKDDINADDYYPDGGFGPDNTDVEPNEYPNYDEYTKDVDRTHQSLLSENKGLDLKQNTGGNTQHIVLGSLTKHDAEVTQQNSEHPDEGRIYQPGERVPGTGGYTIPIGFTGSVKSVASKDKTYAIGYKDSPSQAQTVALSPGSGKVRYVYPPAYGRNVKPKDLRSLHKTKPDDSNRYMSVSKSVTKDLDSDNNIRKQYSHTYYTKSSSCGYFTFTCTMVSGADGRKKVCKPKIPTNPDGTPMKC